MMPTFLLYAPGEGCIIKGDKKKKGQIKGEKRGAMVFLQERKGKLEKKLEG